MRETRRPQPSGLDVLRHRASRQHGPPGLAASEDLHEHQPQSAVATISVTRGCRHPGSGADGVHGPRRRTVAGRRRCVQGPGVVRLQLQLRGQGRPESANRSAPHPALLHRPRHATLLGSSFSIHGTADTIDPVLESMICIGQNPPPRRERADLPGALPADVIGPGRLPPDVPDREPRPRHCAVSRSSCETTTGIAPRRLATSSRSSCRRPLPARVLRILRSSRNSPPDGALHPGRTALERQSHGRLAHAYARSTRKEAEQ